MPQTTYDGLQITYIPNVYYIAFNKELHLQVVYYRLLLLARVRAATHSFQALT